MNRRDFLQRIGLGSLVAGSSVPLLGSPALAHLESDGKNERHFRFVALSFRGTPTPSEAMVMEGTGIFGGDRLTGNGDWQHITWPPPSTLLGHGLWRKKSLVSYQAGIGSFGEIEASILTLRIRMLPAEDTDVDPFNATLKIVCNVGPAGLLTGQTEGFTLTLPAGAPFVPAVANIGLTHISTKH
jgi:hypothetical protein